MGRHIFGCDICQDVCPWNRGAPRRRSRLLQPRPGLVNPDLLWLAQLSPEEFRAVFRGSPVKRTKKLNGLRRNVVIAMANSGDERFVPRLQELSNDEDRNHSRARAMGAGRFSHDKVIELRSDDGSEQRK